MSKLGLIFTTDYELFGNGSGSVDNCILHPTEEMLHNLEEVDARLCIFFEVCEYWAFQEEFRKGNLKTDVALKIKQQLQYAIRKGHDVQLHFHPQWLDYKYENGNWQLNYELWRIGTLADKTDDPDFNLTEFFKKGRQTIEEIVREVKPDYNCEVFRAGAWSMQPEKQVLKSMVESGFKMDSTVAAELNFNDGITFYDFRGAPDLSHWNITQNLLETDNQGSIKEIPIFTCSVPLFKQLYFLGLRQIRKLKIRPENCTGQALASKSRSKIEKLAELISSSHKMFSFGDATTAEEMQYMVMQAYSKSKKLKEELTPVVAISHPKTFANSREFRKFLKWAKGKDFIEFSSYRDFL